jgi:RHS repeat-associated protein
MEEVKRAKMLIIAQYKALVRKIELDVRAAYTDACNARKPLDDALTVTYPDKFYHYTLYYYDIAGRLIKTVSPKGVDFNNGYTRSSQPNHQFVTRFEYNSAGQIIKEETTDGGITLYAYNKRGQLRAVQNARQRAANRYSIVNYDYLQRVKSSMEIDAAAPLTPLSYTNQFTDIVGNNPTDISTLTYSTPTSVASLPAPYNSGTGQKNLRNRLSSVTFDNDALNGDDQATSYYSYDAHGNLDWVIHSNPGLSGIKIEYDYELISGNVKRLNYRRGYKDQLFQRFIYDRDNRLTSGQTSLDTVIWDNDITYSYYYHGPLKRAIIGEDKVQGTDYVYTLQGQLKSINHGSGIRTNDPGQDGIGNVTADYTRVAADAFSLTLGYFDGDYIDHTGGNSIFGTANAIHAPPYNLYDGNISVITSKADGTGLGLSPDYHNDKSIAHLYRYDKLGRLREELFTFKDGANYSRGSGSTIKPFDSYYSYDENSNLKHLSRRSLVGNNPVTANRIDSLSYNYAAGGTNSNRLLSVGDIDGSTPEVNDLQGNSGNNYIYNADGTLSQDVQEKVDYFWNSNDKIRKIVKKDANNLPLVTIVFDYDAQGNKVRKTVFNANNEQLHTTYYVYDALGTLLAIYKKEGRYGQISLIEAPINAPDRIGMWRFYQGEKPHDNFPLLNNQPYTRNVGKKLYELTDQTGNVRVVITDRKKVVGDEARPEIAMSGNYYPYGMAQAGRVASTGADYRYGYNGMEEEDRGDQVSAEIASTGEKAKPGEGNLLNTEYRLYDPRLAQWLTRDPVFQPWESPYSAMASNPILFSDPQGDTPVGGNNGPIDQRVAPEGGGTTQTNPQALTEQNGNNITVGSNGALTTTGASGMKTDKKTNTSSTKSATVSSVTSSESTDIIHADPITITYTDIGVMTEIINGNAANGTGENFNAFVVHLNSLESIEDRKELLTTVAHFDDMDDVFLDLQNYFKTGTDFAPSDLAEKLYRFAPKPSSNPRNNPGVAIGNGVSLNGEPMMRGTDNNIGLVPSTVAEKLRGKVFGNFDQFRRDFWKAVANDPEASKNFTKEDMAVAKRDGTAPAVSKSQELGLRDSYELHHIQPIHAGGGVYNMDNILIVTPRYHKEILSPAYHYKRKGK